MKLGVEVAVGASDIILHEDPAPPQKGAHKPCPTFLPMSLWLNGWMDQDTT